MKTTEVKLRNLIRNSLILAESKPRKIRLSKKQINLLVREILSRRGYNTITEEQIVEIAPMIAMLGRSLGTGALKAFSGVARKGAQAAADYVQKNPEMAEKILAMVQQSSEKLPGLSSVADEAGGDPMKLATILQNPDEDAAKDLDTMLKSGAEEMQQAADCECPTPEDLSKIPSSVAGFLE